MSVSTQSPKKENNSTKLEESLSLEGNGGRVASGPKCLDNFQAENGQAVFVFFNFCE